MKHIYLKYNLFNYFHITFFFFLVLVQLAFFVYVIFVKMHGEPAFLALWMPTENITQPHVNINKFSFMSHKSFVCWQEQNCISSDLTWSLFDFFRTFFSFLAVCIPFACHYKYIYAAFDIFVLQVHIYIYLSCIET